MCPCLPRGSLNPLPSRDTGVNLRKWLHIFMLVSHATPFIWTYAGVGSWKGSQNYVLSYDVTFSVCWPVKFPKWISEPCLGPCHRFRPLYFCDIQPLALIWKCVCSFSVLPKLHPWLCSTEPHYIWSDRLTAQNTVIRVFIFVAEYYRSTFEQLLCKTTPNNVRVYLTSHLYNMFEVRIVDWKRKFTRSTRCDNDD